MKVKQMTILLQVFLLVVIALLPYRNSVVASAGAIEGTIIGKVQILISSSKKV